MQRPIPKRVNFADFNSPVPYSAYRDTVYANVWVYCNGESSRNCDRFYHGPKNASGIISAAFDREPSFQNLIVQEEYHPILVAPHQMRAMDPAWDECLLPLRGFYDPPVALPTTTGIAESGPRPTPAVPGGLGTDGIPGMTEPAGPVVTGQPQKPQQGGDGSQQQDVEGEQPPQVPPEQGQQQQHGQPPLQVRPGQTSPSEPSGQQQHQGMSFSLLL